MAVRDEKTFSFEQSVFASGVATVPDPRLLTDAQYARSLNAYPGRDGHIHKRKGYEALATMTNVRRHEWFVTERGATALVVFHADKVSVVSPATGIATQIDYGLDTTGSIAVAAWNDCLYFSDGVNGLAHVVFPEAATHANRSFATQAFDTAGVVSGSGSSLKFTAVAPGSDPTLTVAIVDPGTTVQSNGPAPAVTTASVTGTAITITLGPRIQTGNLVANGKNTYSFTNKSAQSVIDAVKSTPAVMALINVTCSSPTSVPTAGTKSLVDAIEAGSLGVIYDDTTRSFVYLCARQASERLFGVEAADRTNLRWCAPFDASKWGDGDVISPGGEFTALADTGDTFVMFTRDFVYRIDGTDSKTWQVRKVQSDGLGCIAPRSVQVVEGVPTYLSSRGVAFFDGTRPKLLSNDVYDSQQPAKSLIPTLPNPAGVFSMQTGEHYILVFIVDTHSEAVVYDFRLAAWGGRYTFGFLAVSGSTHPATAASALPTMASATKILREYDGYTDNGVPYLYEADSRTLDGARPTLDKVFNDARLGYTLAAPATVTLSVICEDETVARSGATETYLLPAGSGMQRKRINNARATQAFVRVSSMCECALDVWAMGVDLFFTRPR